jgi:hypothetical protein
MNSSNAQVSGSTLIEDWPRDRTSFSSVKKVSFSTFCSVRKYRLDDEYERTKSYKSKDRKAFQLQAYHDASVIKAMIKSCPLEGGHAILYLIANKMLLPEELLGIEYLIIGAQKTADERKKHAAFVSRAQRELIKANDENFVMKLARAASAKSEKARRKAWLRAAIAA